MTTRGRVTLLALTILAAVVVALGGRYGLARLRAAEYTRRTASLVSSGIASQRIVPVAAPVVPQGATHPIGYARFVSPEPVSIDFGPRMVFLGITIGDARFELLPPNPDEAPSIDAIENDLPAKTRAAIELIRSELQSDLLATRPLLRTHLLAFACPLISPSEFARLPRRQREAYMTLVVTRGMFATANSDLKLVRTPELVALIGEQRKDDKGRSVLFFEAWMTKRPLTQQCRVLAASSEQAWSAAMNFLGSLQYESVQWESKDELRDLVAAALKSNKP